MDDQEEEINSSIVVATLIGKLQELMARAVEIAMHTPDYFFNAVRYEKHEIEATKRRSTSSNQISGFTNLVDKDKRIWLNFPRNCWFYEKALFMIINASKSLPETAINIILEWLPKNNAGGAMPAAARPSSPRGLRIHSFDHFMSLVVGFTMHSDPKVLDMVESGVELAVADVVALSLSEGSVSQLSPATIARLKDLAFTFNKPSQPRVASSAVWPILRSHIAEQWQFILSEISIVSLPTIWPQFGKLIAQSTPEDAITQYKIIRWIHLSGIQDTKTSTEVEKILTQFNLWIEANKKTASRYALLETLEIVLQSLDFSNNNAIFEKAKFIYNRAVKSCKNDDLEPPAIKLIATLLPRSPSSFFEDEFDSFLQKRILKSITNVKKKDFLLDALLRVLRGKYLPQRLVWAPQGGNKPKHNPFAYLGLGGNKAKMMARLQEIIQALFGKKQVLPKVMESVEVLSFIVAQIAAHNLKYTMNTVLPLLFLDTSPSPIYHSIGLRSLFLILDPSLGFWQYAPSALLKSTDPDFVSHKDVLVTFESYLVRLVRICDEQAGPDASAYETISLTSVLDPHSILFAPPLTESPPLSSVDTSEYANKVAVEAVKRWHNVCSKPADVRAHEFDNAASTMNQKVVLIVKKWGSDTSLMPPHELTGGGDLPFAGKTVRKKIKRKTMNLDFLEVYKQVVKCMPLVPANIKEGEHSHARLLLHEDDELVNITSHTLQQIIKEFPQYRSPIVQGLVSVLAKHDPLDTFGQHTLVEHLAGMLDLWNERVLAEKLAIARAATTPQPLPEGSYPNPQLVNEVEAIAMSCMCSPNSNIRILSLQVLKSIYALGRQDNCIAKIMDTFNKDMLQRARYRLLLDGANGVDQNIQFNSGSAGFLPSIEEVAVSIHTTFWTYVLAELGRFAVDQECVRTLTILRNTLHQQISSLPSLPMEPTNDEQRRSIGSTYKQLWTNFHALYFAINGTHLKSPSLFVLGAAGASPMVPASSALTSPSTPPSTPTSAPTTPTLFSTPSLSPSDHEIAVLEQSILSKLHTYLTGFWGALLSDVNWVRVAVTMTCSLAHWRALPTVIDSLAKWFNQNKQNKKKPKLRTEIACVFRRVAQEPKFTLALAGSPELQTAYNNFIQETEPIFGDETKIPLLENSWYFTDHALVVYYYANAIFTSVPCATRGPARLTLVASVTNNSPALYKIFKTLVQWSGYAKVGLQKTAMEAEISKRHSRMVKDTVSRDGFKHQFEKTLQQVSMCARIAAESVARLCPLNEENLQPDILNWVVDAEQNGSRILRWFLSFHFDATFKLFFDKSYTAIPAESVLYLHAIYDQFLPILVPPPPTDGVTQWANDYYKRKANEEHQQSLLESAPKTPADINFASKLIENAPKILHLALYNLAHPAALARFRAFELIHRLGPSGFGRSAMEDDSLRLQLFPYKNAIQSRLTATNHTNALRVSAITSANRECKVWSEDLFAEAYTRFENMNAANRKWTIQFLLPWCDNFNLDDHDQEFNLKAYSTGTFLNAVFMQFTQKLAADGEIPQEMFDLWLRLAVKPTNMTAIVNFLLKKGVAGKDHMPICKTILLHLFCKNPELTLKPLIHQLSLAGVVTGQKEDNDGEAPIAKAHLRTIDPKQIAKQSYMLREAAISILTDLIPESLDPFLAHIHTIVNYCFLRFDSSESQSLTRLMIVIISALRASLHASTPTAEHTALATALETSLLALKSPTFKLKWLLSYETIMNKSGNDKNRNERCTFTTCALPTSPDTHSKMLMRWCTEEVYVSEFVDLLCQYFSIMSKDTIEKWGSEALEWARGYRDLRLSIKGFQLYRAIPKQRTANDITLLMSTLVETEEKMEGALLNIKKWSQDNAKNHTIRFHVEEGVAQLTRAKCLEIILALKQIVPVLKSDTVALSNIFWASVAFMPPNHYYFAPLYQQALEVLHSLQQVGFFDDASHLQEKANTLEFKRGILPYLFKGLFGTRSTEQTAARLMLMCYSIKESSAFIVDPSPARYPLVILGLLPWLYNKRSGTDTKQFCGTLLTSIENGPFKAPKIEEALKQYIAGDFDTCPDDFLSRICSQFKVLCLPQYYPEFSELLTSYMKIAPPEISSVVVKIARQLITLDSLPYFRDICKMCSDRVATIPYAENLLLDVVALAPQMDEVTTPLAPVRDESQKLKYTCILLRQIAGTVSGVVLAATNPVVRRVKHRRNRSGITDHPSLQRNIEQTVIPAYQPPQPEIAKMFASSLPVSPSSSSSSLSSSSLNNSSSSVAPPSSSTPAPTPAPVSTPTSTPAETKGESGGKGKKGDNNKDKDKEGEEGERRRRSKGDEDDDSDFEAEMDHYLLNNDLDPITPQTPRAASRSGWDDGYNSYLDENNQPELFGLDDLRTDLEGLDDKIAQFADDSFQTHHTFPELESLMRMDSFVQMPNKRIQTLRHGIHPTPSVSVAVVSPGDTPTRGSPPSTDIESDPSLGDLRKGLEGVVLNFDGAHTYSVDDLNHDGLTHITSIIGTPQYRKQFISFLKDTDSKAVKEVQFVESVLDFVSLTLHGSDSELLNSAKKIVEKYLTGDSAIDVNEDLKKQTTSEIEKGNTHGVFDKVYNLIVDRLGEKWMAKFQLSSQFVSLKTSVETHT